MTSVVINGAGVVGITLALALSKLTNGDLKIFLIEKNLPKFFSVIKSSSCTIPLSPRIIALSRGGYYELMQMIDVNALLSCCSAVIKKIEISAWNNFREVLINAEDYQLSELGYIVELNTLRKKLFNLLYLEPAITIYCPATIINIQHKSNSSIIVLDNGHRISAKLMIAADGAHSALATHCGMQWLQRNYRQVAVVTQICTEVPHDGTAFEKFTKFGSLALLPISGQFSFLIWCISHEKKEEVINWNSNEFSQELQGIFGWALGKILDVECRCFYDLWLIQAKSHILHRLAVVGNAAQNLHPIAGQGFNLSLRDVVILSKIITRAFYNNEDIGDYSILNMYQTNRYMDQRIIVNITDRLVRLFNNNCLPLVIARNAGLFCLSYSTCLRSLLIHTALYWNTDNIF